MVSLQINLREDKKMNRNTIPEILVIVMLVTVIFVEPTYAYLDPVTGSIIIQSLIAGIAVVGYIIKKRWYQLKNIFSKKKDDNDDK